MKRTPVFHIPVFAALLAAFVLAALAPMPAQAAAQAQQSLVRFTVVNKSTADLSFRLEGPRIYPLLVRSETTEVFTLERGEYTYWVQGCGREVVKGTLDLTKNKKMVMPVCGGRARDAAKNPNTIDLSAKLTLVKILVKNEADTTVLAILTGPSTYVFRVAEGKTNTYTIAKGEYEVVYYACGERDERKFFAYKGQRLELDCP